MPQNEEQDNITLDRKRLRFRSWHRGTREIDLLLGRFADAHIGDFTEIQLKAYDRLLENSDPDIYNWISGAEPVPPAVESDVLRLLLAFYNK